MRNKHCLLYYILLFIYKIIKLVYVKVSTIFYKRILQSKLN